MIKNLIKLFLIFAFILFGAIRSFAEGQIEINSVTFDNSAAFVSINSFDLEDYNFNSVPKFEKIEGENTVYFDIPSAKMTCAEKRFVLNSPEINAVNIYQNPNNPDNVRVEISYNEGYNPANIRLKKAGNTILIQFKYPAINNYYFQTIMQDLPVSPYIEQTNFQMKVPQADNSILGQINSSFNISYI